MKANPTVNNHAYFQKHRASSSAIIIKNPFKKSLENQV